ncbi:meiosis protein MEI2 [Penicillium waksmanii]|uniref:meiosis protein MEI2 n=1 Tax=Penicillium waksmanii TaxID=69791 RepID=UPI0025483187|nr:meiosis protein MEI2 [Penicillium waksmanii]KAJ5966043.1 meiosis protein MEI2 [Penicillium waksmanii]
MVSQPPKETSSGGSASRKTPDSELASFTFHSQQQNGSPLAGRTREIDPRVPMDPFMARAYNLFEGADLADSPNSVGSPPAQSLPVYLDPTPASAPVNLNYPVSTPPSGSYGRSPFSLPLRGPAHTTYDPSAVLGPTSHPREPFGVQNNFASPQISPLQPKDLQTSFCDDRRLLVRNVDTDTEGLEVVQLFQNLASVNGPFWTTLNTTGRFFVSFSDSRDVDAAIQRISRDYKEWELIPLSAEDFTRDTRMVSPLPLGFDDAVVVTVYCGTYSTIQPANVIVRIKQFLELAGKVRSIQELQFGIPSDGSRLTTHELAVKYFDSRHAANAVKALNATRTADFVMEVMPLHRDMPSAMHRHWTSVPKTRRPSMVFPGTPARRMYMSPSDPDSPPIPDELKPARNVIDLSKIYYGQDGRTTVMLRNIPNQMTWVTFPSFTNLGSRKLTNGKQQHLKQVLDLTSANCYDFMYLRMGVPDFDQNQSVGYAFVNFSVPLDIMAFMEARESMCWPGFETHVEKVAEMSYATVQGREALVEKFRNSPVMLNHPDNRPKLFHTAGPRTGRLASFPPVNNFFILAKGVDRSRRSEGPLQVLAGPVAPTPWVPLVTLVWCRLIAASPAASDLSVKHRCQCQCQPRSADHTTMATVLAMAIVPTTPFLVHTAILVLLELVAIIARDLQALIVELELEPRGPGTTVRYLLVPTRPKLTRSQSWGHSRGYDLTMNDYGNVMYGIYDADG